MIERLYKWTMGLAAQPGALWALALVAFAESSFFPIPPDVLLIPMVLAARARAWVVAGVCTAASVAGGIAGYGIGFFLYDTVGRPLVDLFGGGHAFELFRENYNEWGLWIVFTAGLTPLPYKVFTILSGVTQLDIGLFTLGSGISRGLRFFLEALLLWYVGEPIRAFVEGNLMVVTTVFLVLLIGSFLALRYVA